MSTKWFWGIISTISVILLIIFGIRVVAFSNPDVPLFSQFVSLYNNTDFAGTFFDFYQEFYDFINDYLQLENITMPDILEFAEINAWYDIFSIIYNIGILVINIFITLYNLVYSYVLFGVSAILNVTNVVYEFFRIWLVLFQFILGIAP